jgi:plasmid stabilization system protein ParE
VNVRFLRTAQSELQQAVAYYELQASGLGDTFFLEVLSATDRISEFPAAWQIVDASIRRYQLNRSPYALVYTEEGADIVILSVAHLHKRPERWRDRLKKG